jgi:hypothetical protein
MKVVLRKKLLERTDIQKKGKDVLAFMIGKSEREQMRLVHY